MEITQGTQKQSPENTRTKSCTRAGCLNTVTERQIVTGKIGAKVFHAWVQEEWPSPRGFCPACEVAERAREHAEYEAHQNRLAEERRKQRLFALFRSFGGEKPVEEFTLDRFDPMANYGAFQKAKNFDPSKDNLFFYGAAGTGKTHLACAIARAQAEKGEIVEFFKVSPLMREFRRRLDPDDEEAFVLKLTMTPVLVIDDLGVGKATEYVIEKLHEVIDGRLNNRQNGLVLTSNLSLNGIAETFKDRIADRLNGMCELVKFEGSSHRRKP